MDAYELDPVDVRVLGCLVEKQALTPDNYPLTRASLLAACNQSTSREPVMNLSEAELSASLDRLLACRLIGGSKLWRWKTDKAGQKCGLNSVLHLTET